VVVGCVVTLVCRFSPSNAESVTTPFAWVTRVAFPLSSRVIVVVYRRVGWPTGSGSWTT